MRLKINAGDVVRVCFNPRICKRCDFGVKSGRSVWKVSIHASVKDATETKNIKADTSKFQSTHL